MMKKKVPKKLDSAPVVVWYDNKSQPLSPGVYVRRYAGKDKATVITRFSRWSGTEWSTGKRDLDALVAPFARSGKTKYEWCSLPGETSLRARDRASQSLPEDVKKVARLEVELKRKTEMCVAKQGTINAEKKENRTLRKAIEKLRLTVADAQAAMACPRRPVAVKTTGRLISRIYSAESITPHLQGLSTSPPLPKKANR